MFESQMLLKYVQYSKGDTNGAVFRIGVEQKLINVVKVVLELLEMVKKELY